jgi:hypothetical protein
MPIFSPSNSFGPSAYKFSSPMQGAFGAGPFTLTPSQISDLKNGLWYVNVTTETVTNGQLRGPLLLQTEGPVQFTCTLTGTNETKPNNSPYVGTGALTLQGNILNYGVGMLSHFVPTSAGIYGPARTEQDGRLVFNLGKFIHSFNPPAFNYGGELVLTTAQVHDLKAGLWYVNFASSNYPSGQIRGQILLSGPKSKRPGPKPM